MKYSGVDFALLLVDGYDLRASISENVSMGSEVITQQSNPFGVDSEEHTPIGVMKGSLVAGGGLYDAVTDALHSAIGSVTGVSRIICAAIAGNTIGKLFVGFAGPYSQKYEVMDARDGLTKANVSYLVSGAVEEGQIVQDLATFTANWDTKTGGAGAADAPVDHVSYVRNRSIEITSNSIANPSVVTTTTPHGLTSGQRVFISDVATSSPTINGERVVTVIDSTHFSVPVNVTVGGTGGQFVPCNTLAGGAGYLEVPAYSGFTSVTYRIMHSVDDITYAALITFTTITAARTKERVVVAGNVDRYLCSQGTVVGAGNIDLFSGFCRY